MAYNGSSMDTQRPDIRVIALCLFSHEGKILVSRELDSVKGSHFCRPVGGGVEFGESAVDAVRREIREELSQEIEDVKLVRVLENIFELEGLARHEIVFLFDARFADASRYERGEIEGYEESAGASFTAFWDTPHAMAARGERLVPEGLAELLR